MDRFRLLPNYRYYENTDGIITTGYERPLRDYRIYGNSVQDGTPAPDAPIEIQSVGDYDDTIGKYKIPIEVNDEIYNIFLDEPLRKCGDYADYIDFRNGKLVRNTRYFESIYDALNNKSSDGRWGWGMATAYKKTWGTLAITNTYSAPMSNHFLGAITGSPSYAMNAHIQKSTANNSTYGAFPYTFFEEFKGLEAGTFPNLEVSERATIIDEWMIANKVDYLISINTPIETAIELPKIKLHKGTNIIKVKTATQPSQVNWQYYK